MGTACAHHSMPAGSIVLVDPRLEDDGACRQLKRVTPEVHFPEAELAPSRKLKKGRDILLLLRGDIMENPKVMARLSEGAPPPISLSQSPPAADKLTAAKSEPERPAAARQETPGVNQTASGEQQPLASRPKEGAASPQTTPLTVAELVDTAIEVRNGNGTRNLARQTRSRLHQEGFTVARIGNHVDFGAAKTMIYYRPEAENVARAVSATVFPQAILEPCPKLKKGMDIKILLGADLLQGPQLMAGLVAGDS